jgi:anti-anti-sigma regulatory factor
MLRITRTDGTGAVTVLRLEGRLTESEVAELEAEISDCRSQDRLLIVDLAGVTFVDGAGANALVAAHEHRAELVGASSFIRDFLNEFSKEGMS